MSTETLTKKLDIKYILAIAVTIILMFGFGHLPAPGPLTPYGMRIIGIFLGLIWGWSISGGSMIWPALLAMVALATTDYGSAAAVMTAAFGSQVIVLCVVTMMMLGALSYSGVTEWLIIKVVTNKYVQGKPWRLTLALIIGSFIVSILVGQILATLFLFPIFNKLFKDIGIKQGDKYATMLTGTVLLAMLLAPGLFPFDGYMTMFLPIIYASTNVTIEFGPYMLTMIPYILVSVLLLMPMMKLLGYDPSCIAKADFSEIEAKYAGGLSKAQKSLLACVCIFILGAILVSFVPSANAFLSKVKEFGVYGWAMLFCVVMMVIKVDGKPICDPIEAGKSVSWDAIFIIASATVVSGALTSTETGVSEAISALCAPLLAKAGPLSCILLVAFIVLLLTNFLNNIATMFIFIAVICAIYANGVDIPFVAVIQLIPTLGMVGIAIPASSLFGALYYAQDYTTPASIAKCSFILILYVVIMTAVVYVPLTMLFL